MQDGYMPVAITGEDFLFFADRAVGGMSTILGELGDELANTRPALPGANTPFALLTHCLGVMEYWGGHLVAGRPVRRDRQAEFHAAGPVALLRDGAARALEVLRDDVRASRPGAPLHAEPDPGALGPRRELTRDSALQHLYEELAQHHGQMEIMRDCLLAARRPADPVEAPIGWLRAKHGVKWHRPGPSLLPAWVADMDFPLAPVIAEAIGAALDRGDLGYPDWDGHPLAGAFAERMRRRHGWRPDPGHVRGVTDLIQSLQLTLTLLTEPGDGVVAFTPNYPPFLRTLESMRRPLVAAPLEPGPGGGWTWDHDLLEHRVRAGRARILLLVNPHNPTGKVFTAGELRRVADLAERHDLIVISDEIHADLVHAPHRHTPFAALDAGTAARTVTVTSASKAFNIAGLRTALAHVGPAVLRTAWDAQPPDLYGATNVLGVEATRAAWAHGDAWLAAVTAHLTRQRDHLAERVAAMPGLDLLVPEAGYLAWLDCRDAGLGEEAADWFRRNAGVELSAGSEFGSGAVGSVAGSRARLNFATTREVLDLILDRMAGALAE